MHKIGATHPTVTWARPTTSTGVDLLDAYLWIKTPGGSDGECNRWQPTGPADPIWNWCASPAQLSGCQGTESIRRDER
jgi:hypothetical protein